MSFLLRTHIKLATSSLRLNRGRTFLTALGISIGVASIVLILSLAGGINRLISTQIERVGSDLIVVRPSTAKDMVGSIVDELTASNQYLKSNLSLSDVGAIQRLEGVAAAAPIAVMDGTVSTNNKSMNATLVATNPDLEKILSLPMKTGQFLNSQLKENTAVVGYWTAMQLYGSVEAVTKTFEYMGEKFMVVGVLEEINDPINFNNVDFDNAILANAGFMETLGALQIQQVNVRATTTGGVGTVVDEIGEKMSDSRGGGRNFAVLSGSQISHPAGSLFTIVSGMLTLVASISLVVGGVGVMNIMLVSVSERTREIGIRKAVGASSGNILLTFLFESLILSILGGVMGFAVGYACAFLVSLLTPFAPFVSWEILGITGGTSLVVGVLFGIYPAVKAASKNPIQSLKYYR
ncbi:MAG: ABC transporter permease [Candidatus Nomurabacteria bacterium]|jgi:ABC-type antimicrobial peptide transport system permease subunit|nr:ABC transporter permease [Candidatus Nomurabacteria bacterium]